MLKSVSTIRLFLTGLLALFFFTGFSNGQSTYDLRFLLDRNDAVAGGVFEVRVQMRAVDGAFALGSSNLVFEYNDQALGNPELLEAYQFSGGLYGDLALTTPRQQSVSINIVLFVPNQGSLLNEQFIDLATLRFEILDANLATQLIWREASPSASVVFLDDELTAVPAGTLTPLDVLLDTEDPISSSLPVSYELAPNFPNPFNPSTTIQYAIPQKERVKLLVVNVLGETVQTLLEQEQAAGRYTIQWDGRNNKGQVASSGIYFLSIQAGQFSKTQKMILLR